MKLPLALSLMVAADNNLHSSVWFFIVSVAAYDYALESIHESIRMHSSLSIFMSGALESIRNPFTLFTWGDVNSANRFMNRLVNRFAGIIERTQYDTFSYQLNAAGCSWGI